MTGYPKAVHPKDRVFVIANTGTDDDAQFPEPKPGL
jgi:hypothetical protein